MTSAPRGLLGDLSIGVWEILTFGSLITATDTVSVLGVLNAKRVDPHLFSLVFGELSLHDAVAIVMFRTFSCLVGGASGAHYLKEAARFAPEFLLDVRARCWARPSRYSPRSCSSPPTSTAPLSSS